MYSEVIVPHMKRKFSSRYVGCAMKQGILNNMFEWSPVRRDIADLVPRGDCKIFIQISRPRAVTWSFVDDDLWHLRLLYSGVSLFFFRMLRYAYYSLCVYNILAMTVSTLPGTYGPFRRKCDDNNSLIQRLLCHGDLSFSRIFYKRYKKIIHKNSRERPRHRASGVFDAHATRTIACKVDSTNHR